MEEQERQRHTTSRNCWSSADIVQVWWPGSRVVQQQKSVEEEERKLSRAVMMISEH
jgi:hypothetical protein